METSEEPGKKDAIVFPAGYKSNLHFEVKKNLLNNFSKEILWKKVERKDLISI